MKGDLFFDLLTLIIEKVFSEIYVDATVQTSFLQLFSEFGTLCGDYQLANQSFQSVPVVVSMS